MTRMFVAAWPSDDARRELGALPFGDEPGVRPVPAHNWHVTLRFLGDVDSDAATAALGGAHVPRATAVLGDRVEQLGARQLVVPVAGVDGLAAAVRRATTGLGEPDRFAFRGHVTVARTKPRATSALLGASIAAEFDVDEIALVASDLRSTGAVYSTVATFPTR